MSDLTKAQLNCCGHDFSEWDMEGIRCFDETCTACGVTKDDWLEHVEDENFKLQAVVDAIKDIHRQAVSMGGGHSAETRKLTSALGKVIKESD